MTAPLPPYQEMIKLTSEALMALERHKGKYTGIERKRIDYQIRQARSTLARDRLLHQKDTAACSSA